MSELKEFNDVSILEIAEGAIKELVAYETNKNTKENVIC